MNHFFDKRLLLVILFLLGLGLVQVYSSSYVLAIENYGDGHYFFRRQLIFTVFCLFVLFGMMNFPPASLEKLSWPIFVVCVIGIIVTLIPSIGVKAGGASRWIPLPLGARWEPGEMLKLGYCFLMAKFIQQGHRRISWQQWALRLGFLVAPIGILHSQPDFGTLFLIICLVVAILFAYGLRWIYVFGVLISSLPFFYFFVVKVPYRMERIRGFLDPWSDPEQKGFQVIESLLSFHSGGLFGRGLGEGQGKLFFLPEAHTDFTWASLGEEMGFIGAAGVLCLYGFIIYRGFQIALEAKNRFLQSLALGITIIFFLSVFINIGMALGILPTKGLSLPFLSYGGSSLLFVCLSLGVLLNIDAQTKSRKKRVFPIS